MHSINTPLRFNIGEESRPKIEPKSDIENSIFKEQYRQSLKMIASYLNDSPDNSDWDGAENNNNIFAFIGERGSGKTSCMLSVANMLMHRKDKYPGGFLIKEEVGSLDKVFRKIDIVDPSFFDLKNNILEVVIAKMFKEFNDSAVDVNAHRGENYQEKSRNLMRNFQVTKEHLSVMYSGVNLEDDSLEQLQNLAVASGLRKSMADLINCYLDFFGSTKGNLLLISVDDIDLHTLHAFQMVEQIRKYLIHPNVVILMAVKIDQLALVMKLQYANEFDVLLRSTPPLSMSAIDEMVDRYIGKLIPHGQRIFLPDATVYMGQTLEVYKNGKAMSLSTTSITIRDYVTSLIFKKARYLFYHTRGVTSYIIPSNLRELRHLIKLLVSMDDYWSDKGSEYNKTAFKKYFFDTWASNNLDSDGQNIIMNLAGVADAALINKSVLGLLKSRFDKYLPSGQNDTNSELALILNDANVNYNISIGDVMAVIRHIERLSPIVFDHKLLFMIKSFYSMKLYEYYDQITEPSQQGGEMESQAVLKNDYLRGFSNYDKLVGGNFINSALSNIIPAARYENDSNERSISRSRRRINGKLFLERLNNLNQRSNINDVALIEFFAILISRHDDPKVRYREQNEVYYANNLEHVISNFFFDITAFTYNLVDIERTYKRFGDKLYEIASQTQGSILNQIKTLTKRHPDRADGGTKSWVCIRNAEVLEDLVIMMEQRRPRGVASDRIVIKDFFELIHSYTIKTYDFNDKNQHHEIAFSYLGAFATALGEDNDGNFNDIFIPENKRRLNVSVRLYNNTKYSCSNILQRLKDNNKERFDAAEIEVAFYEIFDQDATYDKEETKAKLKILQSQLN